MLRDIALTAGTVLGWLGGVLPALIRDLLGLVAVGLIGYGAWLVAPAAGFITAGLLLLVGTALLSYGVGRPVK